MINICQSFQKRKASDVMTNYLKELLSRFGTIPSKCPIKPGTYDYVNISLNLNGITAMLPFSQYVFSDVIVDFAFLLYQKKQRKFQLISSHNLTLDMKEYKPRVKYT